MKIFPYVRTLMQQLAAILVDNENTCGNSSQASTVPTFLFVTLTYPNKTMSRETYQLPFESSFVNT